MKSELYVHGIKSFIHCRDSAGFTRGYAAFHGACRTVPHLIVLVADLGIERKFLSNLRAEVGKFFIFSIVKGYV